MVVMPGQQWKQVNASIIEDFRANAGACTGYLEGHPLLLVTATGARSGESRTTPLTYHEIDGRLFVAASAGGAPSPPAWYFNVRANPRVVVEHGSDRFEADMLQLEPAERDKLWEQIAREEPRFAEYQEGLERTIPLLVVAPA